MNAAIAPKIAKTLAIASSIVALSLRNFSITLNIETRSAA